MNEKELRNKFIEILTAQEGEPREPILEEVNFLKGKQLIQIPAHVSIENIEGFLDRNDDITDAEFDKLSEDWNTFSDKVANFINKCPVLNKTSVSTTALYPEIYEFLVNGNVHIIRYNDSCTPDCYYVDENDMEKLKEFIRNF